MKSRSLVFICCTVLLAGCAFFEPNDAMPVEEVVTDLEKLNGSKITIVGWMGDWCGGLDCRIFRSPEDARNLNKKDYRTDEWSDAYDHSINFCWDAIRSPFIGNFLSNERVVATGTLQADCKISGGCFDGCDFELDTILKIGF